MIEHKYAKITIPDGLKFSDLKMARDPETGGVTFDWSAIEKICEASGIDPEFLLNSHEDNTSALIVAWYFRHRELGGEADPVQEDLILETILEDQRGFSISHKPGTA